VHFFIIVIEARMRKQVSLHVLLHVPRFTGAQPDRPYWLN
jgi:hypothetical protein